MELTVEYDDEKIAKEEDKNEYIVYVPTTSNTATIYLTSINGNIAEVRNTTNANNIITVDSPDRTLYRLQVSNLSALTESNPYTYEAVSYTHLKKYIHKDFNRCSNHSSR